MGTPKTLKEAIQNGLEGYGISSYEGAPEDAVFAHVRDYLNQKLAVMMFSDEIADVRAAELLRKLIFGA